MIEIINTCTRCSLCQNQPPLLDSNQRGRYDVIWVGLSAKKVDDIEKNIPLSPNTKSGKLLKQIENECENISTYRTNVVKCLPLDNNQKLRYPSKGEMASCIDNLLIEIDELSPKIVILLGGKVSASVQKRLGIKFDKYDGFVYPQKKLKETYFVPVHHPSYISVYKQKFINEYIDGIKRIIKELV